MDHQISKLPAGGGRPQPGLAGLLVFGLLIAAFGFCFSYLPNELRKRRVKPLLVEYEQQTKKCFELNDKHEEYLDPSKTVYSGPPELPVERDQAWKQWKKLRSKINDLMKEELDGRSQRIKFVEACAEELYPGKGIGKCDWLE